MQEGRCRQDLGVTVLQEVKDALNRQEAVRLLLLTHPVEEDGQVVVVVQLLDVNLWSGGRSVQRHPSAAEAAHDEMSCVALRSSFGAVSLQATEVSRAPSIRRGCGIRDARLEWAGRHARKSDGTRCLVDFPSA